MTNRLWVMLLLMVLLGCKTAQKNEGGSDNDGGDGGTDKKSGEDSNPDAGIETDSDTGEIWEDRQPLTTESLVGTWQKLDYLGITSMVLAADGTATRQSPDETVVASFDAGTWSVSEEVFTLSYEAGGYVITESSTMALVDDKLYDEVIIRLGAGDNSLEGDWSGSVAQQQEAVGNPDDQESVQDTYAMTVMGQAFATTATHMETLIFNGIPNTINDMYIGRGTLSTEENLIILAYSEKGTPTNLEPLDPPQVEEWGRRIAKNVIYLEGDADPTTDEVYQKVLK